MDGPNCKLFDLLPFFLFVFPFMLLLVGKDPSFAIAHNAAHDHLVLQLYRIHKSLKRVDRRCEGYS